jgi:hypothetical protein
MLIETHAVGATMSTGHGLRIRGIRGELVLAPCLGALHRICGDAAGDRRLEPGVKRAADAGVTVPGGVRLGMPIRTGASLPHRGGCQSRVAPASVRRTRRAAT